MDGYYLDLDGQTDLTQLLAQVPDIIDALAGIRADGYGQRISYEPRVTSSPTSRTPIDTSADDAADYLDNELWTWANHVCEHRHKRYDGPVTPIGMADWLRRHMTSLAMTPGADEAPRAFRRVIRSARRAARLPGEPETWRYSSTHVARDTQLNAAAIAVAAKELGPEYARLTHERVKSLRKTRRITPVREFEGIPIYRLGDVMDAHLATATRNRGHSQQRLSPAV
ncbi:hypothetical protein [Rhodococcus sp. SJ-2]